MVRISLDKTHYLLIVILAVVVSATTGVTVFTLYQTAYQEQSNQLRDTVSSQARMIESVALYDAQFDYSGDAQFATFSQIRDAHERYQSAKKEW